jgi:hypothetical protein
MNKNETEQEWKFKHKRILYLNLIPKLRNYFEEKRKFAYILKDTEMQYLKTKSIQRVFKEYSLYIHNDISMK